MSNRELEIFQLIGGGLTSTQIADRLNLSKKTISTHRENIKNKLGMKTGSEMVRFAVLWVESDLFSTPDSQG